MIAWILGDALPYIIGIVGAIAGVFLYGRGERRKGAEAERIKRRMNDLEGAKATREKVDAATRDGDAIERLRSRGRLRD